MGGVSTGPGTAFRRPPRSPPSSAPRPQAPRPAQHRHQPHPSLRALLARPDAGLLVGTRQPLHPVAVLQEAFVPPQAAARVLPARAVLAPERPVVVAELDHLE